MRCWGSGAVDHAAFGVPPKAVAGLSGVTMIAGAAMAACALPPTGDVRCWGNGHLGNGSDLSTRLRAVTIAGLSGVRDLSGTCAATTDGALRCWGPRSGGRLHVESFRADPVPSVTAPIALSGHCALVTSGAVNCWNDFLAETWSTPTVTQVPGARGIADATTHRCAVLADGTVRCWGSNSVGQLGDGTFIDSTVPVQVVGITDAVGIAAAGSTSCALQRSGTVSCWGMWPGTSAYSASAAEIGVAGATAIVVGQTHACAIVAEGAVRCWGTNYNGELGIGFTGAASGLTDVIGVSGARSVSVGYELSCAVVDGGKVRCWGSNSAGKLGDETFTGASSATSREVSGVVDAVSVAASSHSACARLASGYVRCWGSNQQGELGVNPGWEPVPVQGLHAAVKALAPARWSIPARDWAHPKRVSALVP